MTITVGHALPPFLSAERARKLSVSGADLWEPCHVWQLVSGCQQGKLHGIAFCSGLHGQGPILCVKLESGGRVANLCMQSRYEWRCRWRQHTSVSSMVLIR